MNLELMKRSAWFGDKQLKGKIRGVALSFHGLGDYIKEDPITVEIGWADDGWLVVYPYYGGWSWMNREARAFVDKLVDSVYEHYSLSDDIPLVCTGGSMGGLSALLYTRYSKRKVSACAALFPVCDLKHHYSERPDLPISISYAFRGYKEDLDQLFIEHSPLQQVEKMPDIPYLIMHGDCDKAVNKKAHSDKLVLEMKKRNMNVEYLEIPGMGHGTAMPLEVSKHMIEFIMSIKG